MAKDGWIYIDGEGYSPDDLTFREQREMRGHYRALLGDEAESDMTQADMMDLLPILAFMVRKRDDPGYTLEQALDTKVGELVTPPLEEEPPPTKPAAKRKPRAAA